MKAVAVLMSLALASAVQGAAPPSTFLCRVDAARVQQLRIYEVNRDNREPFHQRFQDHALRIMKKYQFPIVDMWESESGGKLQFIYLLDWPDRATLDAQWKAFLADAEWIEIKKRTGAQHGQLVNSAMGQALNRISYSPACQANE